MEGNVKVTLAKCGMDCTACRFAEETECPGCMYCLSGERLFEDEECEAGACCAGKGLLHCGQCIDFPCDTLKGISFDVQTGDGGNRLLVLKELRESERGRKRLSLAPPLCGVCLGGLTGIIIGAAAGMTAAWIIAGIIFGTGTGAIVSVVKAGDIRRILPVEAPAEEREDIPSEEKPAAGKYEVQQSFAERLAALGNNDDNNNV